MNSPRDGIALLRSLGASPWLVRHHELVVEAATLLCDALAGVDFDRSAVLLGASLHDAGKIVHPEEMSASGSQHEAAGRALLERAGVASALARFCVTHAAWRTGELEDGLVALADKLWKGKRDDELERHVLALLAARTQRAPWQVFEQLDAICQAIAADEHGKMTSVIAGGATANISKPESKPNKLLLYRRDTLEQAVTGVAPSIRAHLITVAQPPSA